MYFGPKHPDNYVAREQTAYALRDRGLITLDKRGITLTEPSA